MAATADSVSASLARRAFIAVPSPLPTLELSFRLHAHPPCGLRAIETRKTDLTAGRSVALVAQPHPKCPFSGGASARPSVLTSLPSTQVLASRPDYREPGPMRSIRKSTYAHLAVASDSDCLQGRSVDTQVRPQKARIVCVLFGCGCVCSGVPVEAQQGHLQLFGVRVDFESASRERYPS